MRVLAFGFACYGFIFCVIVFMMLGVVFVDRSNIICLSVLIFSDYNLKYVDVWLSCKLRAEIFCRQKGSGFSVCRGRIKT